MENGKMTGTLDSHMRLAEALGIALPDLYRDLSPARKAVEVRTRKAKDVDVFVHDKRSSSEILASDVLNKKMMPVMVKIQKGGTSHKEETKPGIEKFIYVVDGRVEAVVGNERYMLGKGDTLYFNSSAQHYFRNLGTGESRLISVTCPLVL
jgi:glyoxylate utilization-related uncharacterized protein